MRYHIAESLRKTLNAVSPSWSQAVYALWWPRLTKYMQTEQLMCWSGMTDVSKKHMIQTKIFS